MEKMYKDILIVRCRPKSRDNSQSKPRNKTECNPPPIVNGHGPAILNGISNNITQIKNLNKDSNNNSKKQFDLNSVNNAKNVNLTNGHIEQKTLKKGTNGISTNGHDKIIFTPEHINVLSRPCVLNGIASRQIPTINGTLTNGDATGTKRHSFDGSLIPADDRWPPQQQNDQHGRLSLPERTSQVCNGDAKGDQLMRKISSPGCIKISAGGGFHCAGRISRDDYTPEYVKQFEASRSRQNAIAASIRCVPVSPQTTRRRFSTAVKPSSTQSPAGNSVRPSRTSVTVLTESPQFIRNTEQFNAIGTNSDFFTRGREDHKSGLLNGTNQLSTKCRLARTTEIAEVAIDCNGVASDNKDLLTGTIGGKNSTSFPRPPQTDQSAMSLPIAEGGITTQDLARVLRTLAPSVKPLPGYEDQAVPRYVLKVCMDQCYPGLYIGDMGAAKDLEYLKRVGITHVLNTAEGKKMCTVDTSSKYYKSAGIKYLGLQLLDVPTANIAQYFEAGAQFIDDCLNGRGKVLVHCFMGISRSSTIAIAFLMMRRNMGAVEALTTLRQHRSIYPNDGFLRQLVALDAHLNAGKAKQAQK